LMGQAGEMAINKQLSALDTHCRTFIAHSPFVLVGTFDVTGACDVSPRGDMPGFTLVLDDHTLVIPERPGNRRLDSLRNILHTGSIGLLFLIPGVEETLRINGHACLVRDDALLERLVVHEKRPLIAIGVEVEECFLHCAKSLKRSKLWNTTTWPERAAIPTMAQMMLDHARPADKTLQDIETDLRESYIKRIY
jgi:uncharacterized protein